MKKTWLAIVLGLGLCAWQGMPVSADMVATLKPRITVTQEYTDNVDASPDHAKEEWITGISPGVDFSLLAKRYGLVLGYTPRFTYYANTRTDNEIWQDLNVNFWRQIRKNLRFTASETFVRTQEPYTVTEPVFKRNEGEKATRQDTTIRRDRRIYDTSTTDVGLSYQFGPRNFVNLGYNFSLLQNADPEVEDNRRHNPTLAVKWWFAQHMGMEADLSYERGEFSGETGTTNNYVGSIRFLKEISKHLTASLGYTQTVFDSKVPGDDYLVYDTSLGIVYLPSKNSFIDVTIGYFYQDREDGDNNGGLALLGDVGKVWRFRRGAIRISGGTGYDQNYFGAENLGFTVYYRADLSGSYALTKRLTSTGSLSFNRNEYRNEDPQRNDNTTTFTASLHYEVRRWLFLNCSYSYRRLDSNLSGEDYDENRVMLTLNLVPTRPVRIKEGS